MAKKSKKIAKKPVHPGVLKAQAYVIVAAAYSAHFFGKGK